MKYNVRFYASRGSELFNKFMDYNYFGMTKLNCGTYHIDSEYHSSNGVIEILMKTDNEIIKNDIERLIKEYAA